MIKQIVFGLSRVLVRCATALTVSVLAFLIVSNTSEIVFRSFLHKTLHWVYETNIIASTWLYFIGIYIVYYYGKDITISSLYNRLPPRLIFPYRRLIQAVSGLTFLVCAFYSWRLMNLQWPFRTQGLGFPRAFLTAPLFIGLALISFECLCRTIWLREREANDASGEFTA